MARQRKVILPALLIPLFIIGSAAPSRETAPGDIVDEASEVPEEAVFHQAIALNASGELEIVSYFLDDQYAVMGDRIIGFHKDLQASTLAALSVLGRSIDYQALGLATAEAERLKRQLAISPQLKLFSLTDKGTRWKQRTIPYASTVTDPTLKSRISAAITHWNATNVVKFVPASQVTKEVKDAVGVLKIEEGGTSTTWPGSKLVRLKKTASSTASSGTAVHEIGHAIGIEHEHKQGSGGLLVVNLSNIKKSYHDQYTADTDGDDAQTSYDLCSIMHYGAVAGKSWRKDPTKSGTVFTLTDAGKTSLAGCGAQFTSPNCRTLGQRCALSTADREGAALYYAPVPWNLKL